ncbi:MAG: hypothetical protein KDE54_00400, partial [Caldilineaceae bacterium]|nr:hypothetical protein [Caldilineaceae bacterium]
MFRKKIRSTGVYLSMIILGLLALTMVLSAQPALADRLPQSAYQQLQAAWRRAAQIGQYDYHSTILQTTTPAANLRNAGRGSQTQRVRIDGRLDKAADAMQMQVQVGQQPPIAVKIEEGQAFGRQSSGGEWVALEQTPDFFAPGGDPLGFLVATENVRELDPSETGMEDVHAPVEMLTTRNSGIEGVSRYAFELSGPKFAQFMRAQMEAELRRKGELPPSLSLSTANQYVEMTGHGEIWIGANELPMRLLIHVDFPEQASTNGQVSADISTAFSGWAGLPNRAWPQLWHDPTLLLTQPSAVTGISPQLAQEMGMTLAATLFVLGLLALLLTHRRLWAVRAAVYELIIFSMVMTPLLQSQQVSAFYDGQQARALEEVAANQEPTTENAYNPYENPLRLAMATSSGQPSVREAVQATTVSRAVMAQVASDCTVTESSDCDKDGLIDQIEIHQLGTFVNDVDTDGDLISDKSEIQPFTVGGQSWYLDPRSPDSNGDGLADSTECSDRVDVRLTDYTAPSSYAACPDTDGDGTPDVYDFDNDGDGVPDSADSAPDEFQPITDGKFGFALKGYEANRSLFVDLVIRPTDDRHLWWANNVLDWPANDVRGQVQRVTDDEMPGGGDMRLTPLLEVAIPYSAANPTRGLPVLDGVEPNSVGKTTPLDEWVDQERLASYGIVHSGPRTQDGLIYLYAPMAILEDKTGQTPVAFGATLLYEMAGNASGWGSDHEMRLIWTVNGLVDSCDVDAALENGLPADEADTYCNDYANWTSQSSPLQAYYDDFVLTSLTVQEDHGASALIVAQNANDAAYESDLWHLADTLHDTYLEGETVNNQRLTLSQIPSHFNGWGIGNGALSVQVFSDLHDQTALAEALTGAEILTALSTSHPNAGEDDAATLLFVVEQTAVSASLGATGTTVSAGTITLDLSGMDAETTGAVRWNPYLYANGGWTQQNVASYVSQLTTALASVLTKDALVNAGLASAADDAELVSDGAAVLATNYYLTLYAGGTALVASGDSNLDNEPLVDGDHEKPAEPVMTIVARLTAAVQNRFAQLSLSNLTIESSDSALENVANATWANLASSPSTILTAMGQVAAGDTSSSALLALEEMVAPPAPQSISGSGMLDAMALVFTAYTLKFEAGSPGANTIPGDVRSGLYVVRLGLVLNQLHEAYEKARTIQDIKSRTVELLLETYERDSAEFAAAYNSALQSFARAENASRWVANKPSVYMARLGLVFDLALIGYTFTNTVISQHVALDSPAFNQLAAQAVAQVIVAASSYALTVLAAASPGLNILLVLVLLVDAVISIVCAAENRHDWWCGGINGLITKGITYAINDVTLLMDLEREDQFTVDFDTPTLKAVDQVEGFAVGNTLALSATITANAYTGHPTWMGYLYSWQLRDENVKETAVDFRLQGSQTDFENTLRFGGTDWRFVGAETILDSSGNPAELPQPGKRFEAEFQTSTDAKLERAGVNVGLSSAYLSEAVRVKKQDCWLTFIPPVGFFPFCGTDEVFDSTFHQSLEETFVFDVFPATLDEFHTLVQDTAGEPGMRLAWDEAFPLLRDADGDGLVSKAFNGPDPDDGNPDTDADGLSDFYEYQNGFNATEADGDCDGLTDYWEAFYNTDPKNRDSDHDGLTDGREVLHPNVRYPYEKSVFSNATAPSCAGENGLTGNYAGGWSTVYAFNGDAPLHYWVSSDPNDADSDDDGLTDRSEQVYGYNPHAPSELDVLALETQISTSRGAGAYVGTGDTIDYAATVTNDLSDRYLRGLLESELPVDHVIKTQEIDLLTPLAASTLRGNIAVADAGISASSATSMTLRAGVNVDDAVDNGQSLWLHMNEAPGATTFADASLNGNDVSCTACPTATGSALRFSSVEQQIMSGPHLFDFNAFSVGMWVKQVSDSGGFIPLTVINTQTNSSVAYITWDTAAGGDSTRVNGGVWHNNSSTDVATTFTNWPGTWKNLMLTYDRAARTLNFYLNGVSIGSKTNAVQIDTNPAALQVMIGGIVDSPGTHVFEMDEFEFYPRVLDANTILERYGKAPIQFDLTQTGNGVSCSGSRCPTMNSDGATFDQTKHLALDTSSLSFSNNQFSIAVNVKPQLRPHPFNEGAGSHFGIDTSQDWQGVYGYQDPSNAKLIFPSLYVGSQGALRIDMGDGTNTCNYQTADDIVAFDVEQQVAISYDGSAFTVYVNGEEQASGAPTACSGVQIPDVNQLYAGRPNNAGYFYWDRVTYDYLNDVLGDAELCLTFDVNSTAAALWHDYNVPYVTNSIPRTDQLDVGKRIADDATHWFRFHEDDAANDSCNYSSSSGAYTDDELVHKDNLSNASGLGGTFSSGFQDRDNDPDKGTLYWSLSNEFFVGTLRNLRVFDYALSPTGAERVYNTETFALQMDFDEAPGETTMTDSSGNYFVAGCAGASCPDSGIPGRWNGALRF